jgi:hypothetical protein
MPTKAAQERKPRERNENARYRNVSIDREVHEELVAIQSTLAEELGFVPTIPQTIRLLIKRATPKAISA